MRKLIAILCLVMLVSCDTPPIQQAQSDSGVKKASVKVKTDVDGNTVEQKNYMKRVDKDNALGSIKHLYIISSYTGDVLEYSTVEGKVTSGGKRLSPSTVNGGIGSGLVSISMNTVTLGGQVYVTDEVPDEYGMYGTSSPYFYWFDAQGNYHQYYPSGGTYVHISDKPLRIRKSNLSVEIINDKDK